MNSETRICQNCRQDFVIEPDDFSFYENLKVPPPTFCPDCRQQRRLNWRNDINLCSRTCALCKKQIISIYAPNGGITVYCQKCWWGDGWDPKSYGQEYDSSKSFFKQFAELQKKVPALTMVNDNEIGSVNSEYTHDFARGKNCYMTFVAWRLEDCLYSVYVIDCKEIAEALYSMGECELTYETVYTDKCYGCRYAYYSSSLSNCAFVYDCKDCTDCFMSAGLRHKRYCFKNQQYTKEEYEKILEEYRLDTYSGIERAKEEFKSIYYSSPRRFAGLRNCLNCTGDGIINGKNSKFCFNIQRPENDKWVVNADSPTDCYDLSTGGESSFCYEGITTDNSYRTRFAIFTWKSTEVDYADGCHSSKNLFGCSGLKKGEYCILNKQYTKEEYEKLRARIIEDMNVKPYVDKKGRIYKYGEFFPAELSYFKYNESVAQDYFSLDKKAVEERGLNWQDQLQRTTGKETLKPEEISDGIGDVQDSITDEVLACITCKRNYKIIPAELKFYKKIKAPVPRRCFYCRHRKRFELSNPSKLWRRKCMCNEAASEYKNATVHSHGDEACPNEFETPFKAGRAEIVYCEQCYNSEIV